MQNYRQVTTALSLLIAMVGAMLIWLSSVWGIGVSPDSAVYIASARRLDSISGLFGLSAQYPPGYPVLLALFSILPGDILNLTRIFQCLMFALNLWMVIVLVQRICRHQGLSTLLAPLVFALSATAYTIHFYAWSEGPFIFTQLLSAVFLLDYFVERKPRALMYAAGVASLSIFFRYAGVAWIGATTIAVFVLAEGPYRNRLRTAGLYWLVSALPFAVWLLLNIAMTGESTNRMFAVHIVDRENLLNMLKQFGVWIGLNQGLWVCLVLVTGSVGIMLRASEKAYIGNQSFRHFFLLSAIYIPVYTLFIVFSRSFFDAYIPFDDRIFIPVYFFGYLSILGAAIILIEKAEKGWKVLSAVLVALLLLVNARPLVPLVKLNTDFGTGYLSQYMAIVSDIRQIEELRDKVVYSNAPDYLRMISDLDVRDYPRKFAPTTLNGNDHYAEELAEMRDAVLAGNSMLVHYDSLEWRSYYPNLSDLQYSGFQPVLNGRGVSVLVAIPPNP